MSDQKDVLPGRYRVCGSCLKNQTILYNLDTGEIYKTWTYFDPNIRWVEFKGNVYDKIFWEDLTPEQKIKGINPEIGEGYSHRGFGTKLYSEYLYEIALLKWDGDTKNLPVHSFGYDQLDRDLGYHLPSQQLCLIASDAKKPLLVNDSTKIKELINQKEREFAHKMMTRYWSWNDLINLPEPQFGFESSEIYNWIGRVINGTQTLYILRGKNGLYSVLKEDFQNIRVKMSQETIMMGDSSIYFPALQLDNELAKKLDKKGMLPKTYTWATLCALPDPQVKEKYELLGVVREKVGTCDVVILKKDNNIFTKNLREIKYLNLTLSASDINYYNIYFDSDVDFTPVDKLNPEQQKQLFNSDYFTPSEISELPLISDGGRGNYVVVGQVIYDKTFYWVFRNLETGKYYNDSIGIPTRSISYFHYYPNDIFKYPASGISSEAVDVSNLSSTELQNLNTVKKIDGNNFREIWKTEQTAIDEAYKKWNKWDKKSLLPGYNLTSPAVIVDDDIVWNFVNKRLECYRSARKNEVGKKLNISGNDFEFFSYRSPPEKTEEKNLTWEGIWQFPNLKSGKLYYYEGEIKCKTKCPIYLYRELDTGELCACSSQASSRFYYWVSGAPVKTWEPLSLEQKHQMVKYLDSHKAPNFKLDKDLTFIAPPVPMELDQWKIELEEKELDPIVKKLSEVDFKDIDNCYSSANNISNYIIATDRINKLLWVPKTQNFKYCNHELNYSLGVDINGYNAPILVSEKLNKLGKDVLKYFTGKLPDGEYTVTTIIYYLNNNDSSKDHYIFKNISSGESFKVKSSVFSKLQDKLKNNTNVKFDNGVISILEPNYPEVGKLKWKEGLEIDHPWDHKNNGQSIYCWKYDGLDYQIYYDFDANKLYLHKYCNLEPNKFWGTHSPLPAEVVEKYRKEIELQVIQRRLELGLHALTNDLNHLPTWKALTNPIQIIGHKVENAQNKYMAVDLITGEIGQFFNFLIVPYATAHYPAGCSDAKISELISLPNNIIDSHPEINWKLPIEDSSTEPKPMIPVIWNGVDPIPVVKEIKYYIGTSEYYAIDDNNNLVKYFGPIYSRHLLSPEVCQTVKNWIAGQIFKATETNFSHKTSDIKKEDFEPIELSTVTNGANPVACVKHVIAQADSTDNQITPEPILNLTSEAQSAVYRIAAGQIRKTLQHLLTQNLPESLHPFFCSEMGMGLLNWSLGYYLNGKTDERLQQLGEEFRVSAISGVGNTVIEELFNELFVALPQRIEVPVEEEEQEELLMEEVNYARV